MARAAIGARRVRGRARMMLDGALAAHLYINIAACIYRRYSNIYYDESYLIYNILIYIYVCSRLCSVTQHISLSPPLRIPGEAPPC